MNAWTIGFEAEYTGGDPAMVTRELIARGLWNVDDTSVCDCGDEFCDEYSDYEFGQHYNHCCCNACEWGASPFRHHNDPTVNGEIVSDPMTWPSPHASRMIGELAKVMRLADCRATSHAGFHIHVERDETTVGNDKLFDYFALYEDEIRHYARQSLVAVRSYNYPIKNPDWDTHRDSPWYHRVVAKHGNSPGHGWNLARRNHTWEFRIWNSTTTAWRMHMACSITVAFMNAVAEAPADVREHTFDGTLMSFIAPHLRTEDLGVALRHLHLVEAANA